MLAAMDSIFGLVGPNQHGLAYKQAQLYDKKSFYVKKI